MMDVIGCARRSLCPFASIVLLLTALISMPRLEAQGQITSITDQTTTPTPGTGHDYIQMLAETVNPANGAVSLRIDIPTPKARGFTLPFSVAYDTNGVQLLVSSIPGEEFWTVEGSPVSRGGWSYSIPRVSWTEESLLKSTPAVEQQYCSYMQDYVFYDPSGGRHPLELTAATFYSPTSTITQYFCNFGNVSIGTAGSHTTTGSDGYVQASLAVPSASQGKFINSNAPLTVSDAGGTVYYFNGFGTGGFEDSGLVALPYKIEDRNGNEFSVVGPSQTGAFDVTDSLGRTALSVSGTGPSGSSTTNTIDVPGETYTVNWTTTTAKYSPTFTLEDILGSAPQYDGCIVPAAINDTFSVISSIQMPNNQSYTFYYGTNNPDSAYQNPYGLISEIIYPSGAWVKYKWKLSDTISSILEFPAAVAPLGNPNVISQNPRGDCVFSYPEPVVSARLVGLSGSSKAISEQDFTYWTDVGTLANKASLSPYKTTKVVTTDNILGKSYLTAYAYAAVIPLGNSPYSPYAPMSLHPVPAELKVQYYDWGNTSTPLLTTTKAFSTSQMFLLCNFQTRDDNLSAGHLYQYHFGGQISDDKEYSYGQISSPASFCPSPGTTPPTPARETITNYQTVSSPQQNVFEKPSSVIVNGSGSRVAETDYTYDGSSLAGVSAVSHDDTLYSASAQSGRGNLTTSIERCFPSCTDISTQFSYDSTGQVTSITDGLNNITGLAYTDSPSGGNAAGNSNAYLTKVTRPSTNGVNHIAQYQYNYVTGRLATAIDENSQSTTYQYNDPLFRLTDIYAPPSPTTMPHTQYAYTDGTTPSLTATNPIGVQNEVIRDGLGRSTETVVLTDPVSPVYTRTSYYGEGQVYQQWNATRCDPDTVSSCPNETTFGYTSFQYDALGRKKQQTDSDEVSTQTWSYSGPTVTYTDENGNQWKRSTDSLGRLGTVLEPNGTTKTSSMETDYGYDALNNLLSVMQCGALCSSPASNGPISRSFHYDSLSRLYSASNPEAGTTGYTYDANSNLQSKTDARVIKTQFGYDALNRAISKTYPSDTTGTTISCYQYDSSSISGAGGNLIGRLTNAWTQSHSSSSCTSAPTAGSYLTLKSILAYDAMGRPTGAQQQQCIGSKCSAPTPYALGMLYDLAGNQTALTNSAGASGKPLTLTNYFDTASRPCLTTSSWSGTAPLSFPLNLFQTNPSTSASPLGYAPFGGLQNWYMGSSSSTVSTSCGTSPSSPINITQGYTNRLWLNSISATGQIP